MRLTPPQPDPPRLRQFPAADGGCRPLAGTGVGSRCCATGSNPILNI